MPHTLPPAPRGCRTHNLWCATHPTPSQDGRSVYVVCTCGRRRVVPVAQWREEEARRAVAAGRDAARA